MDNKKFLENYIQPATARFNPQFTLPLPVIPGLKKNGEFIVQGHLDNTYSTNIITRLDSDDGMRLVEVYKNTEDQTTGVFIRLVGTMSLVKRGYPFVILDAAVSNVNLLTFQKENITTRIAVHFPQADSTIRQLFTERFNSLLDKAGIACGLRESSMLPSFWGPFWSMQFEGSAFDSITSVRGMVWESYDYFCRQVPAGADFDYQPALNQIVFKNAQAEHHMFKKMGLSVAMEAQAAFFSMLVAGV